MIDFRYHIVSLVSVFIALAIGVVLGAGPLRESIGDTLTTQVEALRGDKANLQMAVANREEQVLQRDQFIAAVAPQLVDGRLGGRGVVLLTLPGAQSEAVDVLAEHLRDAGAEVTGRVEVEESWTDPGQQELRDSLADELGPVPDATASPEGGEPAAGENGDEAGGTEAGADEVGADEAGADEEEDSSAVLADVLAWALAAPDLAAAVQEVPEAGDVLERLAAEGLVATEGVERRATLVLVVAPAPQAAPDDEAAEQAVADAERWLPLLTALDQQSAGAVVSGPLEAATSGGLVQVVRESELLEDVSTTDAVDTPAGRVIATLVLREQLSPEVGHYGFGQGADAIMPTPVTTAAP